MKPIGFLQSKIIQMFGVPDEQQLTNSKEQEEQQPKKSYIRIDRSCIISTCLAVILSATALGLTVLAMDVWNPVKDSVDDAVKPEIYLCSPTPYRAPQAIHEKLTDTKETKQKPLTRSRRAANVQIRRVIRPLSLPPHIGWNFQQEPPLYHDGGARCSWVELPGKKILGLDEISYDYQLLELINCSDLNDCKSICLRMYKPDDPNLCNYFSWNKSKQLALFYYVDPLINWNITNDDKVTGFFWKCSTVRCDWFWRRHQRLRIIERGQPNEHLITETHCRDFGSCQRQCETHPTCNYVITPTNRTIGGNSFLYTLPNQMFRQSNFTIDELLDSFEMFCKEGDDEPSSLPPEGGASLPVAPAVAVPLNPAAALPAAPAVTQAASPPPVSPLASAASSARPVPSPNLPPAPPAPSGSIAGAAPVVSAPAAPPVAGQPVVPPSPVVAPGSPPAAPPGIALNAQPPPPLPGTVGSARRTRSICVGLNCDEKHRAFLKHCAMSGYEMNCDRITSEVVDENRAKCLRISLDDADPRTDAHIQLALGTKGLDWTSSSFWLSLRQPDNPLLQQDVYLRPSFNNEVELVGRTVDKGSNPFRNLVKQKLCKAQCLNSIATAHCGCTTLKKYSSITDMKVCSSDVMQDCVYHKGANEETNKCLKSCSAESQDVQYTVYVKSTLSDESEFAQADSFMLDIKFNYTQSYNSFGVLCISIVLAFVAMLCIVLFIFCCLNGIRRRNI